MKKLIYLLTLIIPLSAQEAKDDPFHDSVGKETEKEETITQKAVRHIQDADWRKFQAAHRRSHSKRAEEYSFREINNHREMADKRKIRQAVRLVVVGGLAYYIGYHQGEEHFKGSWDRHKYWSDRK